MTARRTALLAAVLLALAPIAGCTGSAHPAGSPDRPSPASTLSPAPSGPDPDPDHDDEGIGEAPSAAPAPQAVLAAQDYIRAWARPDLDQKTWLAGVARYATPAYLQLLATVEPGNVTARHVTGAAKVLSSSTAVVVLDVPTDAGPVRVTCSNTDGRWLVATAEPPGPAGE